MLLTLRMDDASCWDGGNEGSKVQTPVQGAWRVLPPSDEEEEGPRWRGAGKGGETEAGEGSVSPGGAGHFYPLLLRGQRGQ